MRTLTIYNAVEGTEHIWNPHGIDHGDVYSNKRVDRAERQCRKFYAELLRRMDERDKAAARAKWLSLGGDEKERLINQLWTERDEARDALLVEREACSKRATDQVADGAVKLLAEELAAAQAEILRLTEERTRAAKTA